MNILDILGGNQMMSTIELLCASNGATMSAYERDQIVKMRANNQRFFVFISPNCIDIMQMRERSELVGKIVSGRLRRGTVFFFHDGAMREITWNNWKQTWKMITPKVMIERDDRIRVPKRERTSFDDAMPHRNPPKPSRKGFQRTFAANEAMNYLSHIL